MKSLGKSVLFLGIAGLLLLLVWSMLRKLTEAPGQPSVTGAFGGGLMYTLGVTGVFGMLNQALPLYQLLGPRYYALRGAEQISWLYRVLRVEWLRRFLCWVHYHRPQPRRTFFGGRRADLPELLKNIQGAECTHLLALLAMLALPPYFLYLGRYDLAAGAAVGNFFGNFYPIVLQRHHRGRLLRLHSAL
ncbi:glycosyl-4,4'-diaponeurosporenoate acyltransferase CrtO family protein [Hymenobacter weizhouensis]|uniref:glycosyl-4,4'-diaponeurosporenoate acyltransferase CrtO family protein n=1 Tax=Hymenobacter sp. YIM 151500-1 TaxID=2987689 RepID=UPI002227508E|nr:hypothetical protein [Hymenobacter sp. YIM 151500-1]UYZ63398.1 hypothetical protein OIS53_00800 [Hymenobacter sp. YIM 151500-1]